MNRRIIIFDLALAILLVFGIARLRSDWIAFDPLHDVAAVKPLPETLPALPAAPAASDPGAGDWTEIPSRNPFSFDRNDITILAPVAEPPAQVGPKPVLFGTMSLGQDRIAMLAPPQAASRGSRPAKVGETVAGWKVVEILEKSIVVEANGVRDTVLMNDPTAAPPRNHTTTLVGAPAASAVTTVGGSQAAASAAARSAEAPPSASATPGSPGPPPGFRDIRTPFGVFRQPIQ